MVVACSTFASIAPCYFVTISFIVVWYEYLRSPRLTFRIIGHFSVSCIVPVCSALPVSLFQVLLSASFHLTVQSLRLGFEPDKLLLFCCNLLSILVAQLHCFNTALVLGSVVFFWYQFFVVILLNCTCNFQSTFCFDSKTLLCFCSLNSPATFKAVIYCSIAFSQILLALLFFTLSSTQHQDSSSV